MLDKYGYSKAILGAVDADHMHLKEAKSSDGIEESHIIIVSKDIKDAHYESYIYCFGANKDGKDMHIVSYFMKELYLGRYLIKRNFYFEDRKDAVHMYADLEMETERIRDEYYEGSIENYDIPVQIQNFLSEKNGNIEAEEDTIGTTVSRDHVRDDSSVRDWFERGTKGAAVDDINRFKKESRVTEDSYLKILKQSSNTSDKMEKTAESEGTEEAEELGTVAQWFEEQSGICEQWRENSLIFTTEEEHLDISGMNEEE